MPHTALHRSIAMVLARLPLVRLLPTQFVCFACFGTLATLLDWTAFAVAHFSLGWHYLVSATLAFVIASLTSFSGNKYLTFGDRTTPFLRQYVVFVTIAIGAIAITYAILVLLIERFGIHAMIAKIAATFLVLGYNYCMHTRVTFRYGTRQASSE